MKTLCLNLLLLCLLQSQVKADTVFVRQDTIFCTVEYHGLWYMRGEMTIVNLSDDTLGAPVQPSSILFEDQTVMPFDSITVPCMYTTSMQETDQHNPPREKPAFQVLIRYNASKDLNETTADYVLFFNREFAHVESRSSDAIFKLISEDDGEVVVSGCPRGTFWLYNSVGSLVRRDIGENTVRLGSLDPGLYVFLLESNRSIQRLKFAVL